MKHIESGECVQRNSHCWRAILDAVEEWGPESKGGELEARFEEDVLQLVFSEPDKDPINAQIDIDWIAYSDQADRFGILTRMALVDIEMERLMRRAQERDAGSKSAHRIASPTSTNFDPASTIHFPTRVSFVVQ